MSKPLDKKEKEVLEKAVIKKLAQDHKELQHHPRHSLKYNERSQTKIWDVGRQEAKYDLKRKKEKK